MPRRTLTTDEKRWQAEDDARTLAAANVILQDKARIKKAQTAAERMAKEERERAAAMTKVATTDVVVSKSKPNPDAQTGPARKRRSRGRPSQRNPHNVFQPVKK